MILTYQGASSIKVQFGDTTIAVNPVSKDSKKYNASRFGADICLISANNPDVAGREQVSFGGKEPFVIDGPGEYEKGGIFIRGLESKTKYGEGDKINTIYTLTVDSINLCFLGLLGNKDLPGETLEQLEEIDMLFVPTGVDGVLSTKEAMSLAVSLEPKVMVPIYFGNKKGLETFLKEVGKKDVQSSEKLTLKKKDLDGKEGDIMILEESK